jgi:hypothetical protein
MSVFSTIEIGFFTCYHRSFLKLEFPLCGASSKMGKGNEIDKIGLMHEDQMNRKVRLSNRNCK